MYYPSFFVSQWAEFKSVEFSGVTVKKKTSEKSAIQHHSKYQISMVWRHPQPTQRPTSFVLPHSLIRGRSFLFFFPSGVQIILQIQWFSEQINPAATTHHIQVVVPFMHVLSAGPKNRHKSALAHRFMSRAHRVRKLFAATHLPFMVVYSV